MDCERDFADKAGDLKMAGVSHAGILRAEYAAIAVCSATVAAFVPLALLDGEAQAAGSNGVVSAAVAVASTSPKAAESAQVVQGAPVVEPIRVNEAKPIPAAVAPRERLAPRSLGPLTEAEKPVPPPVSVSPTPSGWYTPIAKYYFSARFGVAGSWSIGRHTGLDFVASQGTPIRAAADGVVVAAASADAYGKLLQIKVAPKTQIWMAHLERFNVKPGDVVKAGQVVGRVGMTGNTTGPHLHFEVRIKGKSKNPEAYLWPDGDAVTRIRR